MNQQSSSTRPPRLLQVLTTDFVASDGMGGMERAAIVMARELGHRGWSVRTLVPISPKTPALLKWCRNEGIVADAHPGAQTRGVPHTLDRVADLAALIRRWRPDVMNLHYGVALISLKDVLAARDGHALRGECTLPA